MYDEIHNLTENEKLQLSYKLQALEIILELYPEIRKDKAELITILSGKYQTPIKYILNKFRYNSLDLYADPNGMIVDQDLNFYGFTKDMSNRNLELSNLAIYNNSNYKTIMNQYEKYNKLINSY
jgi:hypothetical protein